MGLETAKRGIMVNQKAMDIVGNNISNLKTKGYTRQRLDTVTVQVHGRGKTLPLAGQGVEAVGVAQVRNSYLDAKFRQEYGDVGYYDQKAAILQELEAAISDPEVENTGIGNALKVLSNALADFSNNPDQETHANIVMNAMKGVTQILNEYSGKLTSMVEEQKNNLRLSVEEINTSFDQLTILNQTIADEVGSGTDYDGVNYLPNDLIDKRNLILDDLARYGSVEVTPANDGSVQVKFNGKVVVDNQGGRFSNDQMMLDRDGITLKWNSTNEMIGGNNGALKGFQEVLTGKNAVNRGIPYYQEKLDDVAVTLADVFNHIVHEDDPANPGPYKQLLEGAADGSFTAGSITISDRWTSDSSYVIRKNNPAGSKDNTDILAMKKALENDYGFGGEYKGSFGEFVSYITTSLGDDIKANQARLEAAVSVAERVDTDRLATSGVSLNEEGINMMTYNKAYQALGRLMTVMDEQLDTIINKMGLVGR